MYLYSYLGLGKNGINASLEVTMIFSRIGLKIWSVQTDKFLHGFLRLLDNFFLRLILIEILKCLISAVSFGPGPVLWKYYAGFHFCAVLCIYRPYL